MHNFQHVNAATVQDALSHLGDDGSRRLIAGGTDLVPLMRSRIVSPDLLVNMKTIAGLEGIKHDPGASIRFGPLTPLDEIERHPVARERLAPLVQAIAVSASPQLRHVATIAGSLCQRPRCWYFRGDFHCLKKGGDTCFAFNGENQHHAILGGGPCYIIHPSDPAPALLALDARLIIQGPDGSRTMELTDFFILPRIDPHRENVLKPNEVIVGLEVPDPPAGTRGVYLKAMERQVWSFAMASVAVSARLSEGVVRDIRIILGGLAPIPWRATAAEAEIEGKGFSLGTVQSAADAALAGAKPLSHNAYKVPLAKELIKQALLSVAR